MQIPAPVIAVVSDVLAERYTHSRIDYFIGAAGLEGERPNANKIDKVREWLRRANARGYDDPLAILGRVIIELMEVDFESVEAQSALEKDRARVNKVLGEQGLREPYATLVLFLAITGLRSGEAIGIKWSDFDEDVLKICRRIYEGKADTTKTEGSNRSLPIPALLLKRLRSLGGTEWVFRSRENTPINPGNALKRDIRPVTKALAIPLGGWHDFRHTLTTGLLRSGISPKVVSEILGHSDVEITLNVYDHPEIENFREPLAAVANQLLRDVTKSELVTQ
jgi:integrase